MARQGGVRVSINLGPMLAILAAVLLVSGGLGWSLGHASGYTSGYQQAVQDQHDALTRMREKANDAQSDVVVLRQTLNDLVRKHARAAQQTAKVLAQRKARSTARQHALEQQLRELTHASKTDACQNLADLPLCAAVAGRLWPAASPATGHAGD